MAIPQVDNFGPSCLAASWAMFAITAGFVSMRLYCRRFHGAQQLALDDYITVLTMVLFCLSVILLTLSIYYGLGKKYAVVDPLDAKQALYWLVMISSVSIWSFSIPKLAIVALIQRLLRIPTWSWTGAILWGLAMLSQAAIMVVSVLWYKQCQPVAYQWDRDIDGSCPGKNMLMSWGYGSSAYSAFLDVFFALYPIPAVMRLNMPLRNRISVSVALGLSSIGCAVSVYKIVVLVDVLPSLAEDPLHPMPYLFVLVFAETMVLVTCASIPALGPLVRLVQGKVSSYRERSSKGGGGDAASRPKSGPKIPLASNQGQTLITIGGRNWKSKQKVKRARSGGTTRIDISPVGSSDEIPLARVESMPRTHSEAGSYVGEGVRKTTQILVSSEMEPSGGANQGRG